MTHGIHHVTAIAGPARRNIDFHTRILGTRLVKKTVNFDDPGTYHLYYGDEAGTPGTILTFFPWEHVAPGRIGIGQTQETAFRVPQGSIGYWSQRFVEQGVKHQAPVRRFGETVLSFEDPDGMPLALVGVAGAETEPAWTGSDIPAEHAIRGFHGVTLLLREAEPTAAILTDVLGFREVGREGTILRLESDAAAGSVVQLRAVGDFPSGRAGGGTVHHVAFRASDDAAQAEMVRRLAEGHGIEATEQKDRNYFRSVYFREPGGVLFEIATDDPGFAVDEPVSSLGQTLRLPGFLEPRRGSIEAVLPRLEAA
ncbi:ring-cleaving dioxygenase [Enterovirga rhinocerotis]|uniref:Glyoxalase family protein n=1 Tax=Enterovirga rhinocerotis TaxID=1339210 RepID=A0A4R7C448_9HYPH|nr:ring-cleaving dioxygenase [Enterovirga rhinocerotis]TDR93280.1 glyoxalase family protein [Enterovirga rhinocerotis]